MSYEISDDLKKIHDTPRADSAYQHKGSYGIYQEARLLEKEMNQYKTHIEFQDKRIKELEAIVNDPNALWTNWLRGTVSLPSGIGDVRQYQEYIKRLDDALDCIVVSCSHLNHKKKHQHKYNEPCPVEQLIRKAMQSKP